MVSSLYSKPQDVKKPIPHILIPISTGLLHVSSSMKKLKLICTQHYRPIINTKAARLVENNVKRDV